MTLSIIIISYNTCEILKKCLDNLLDIKNLAKNVLLGEIEVIVVDNASIDGSAEMVAKEHNWVKLIKNPQNLGLAKSSNIGLENAKGKYLLYMGSDAFPTVQTLVGMVDYMNGNSKVGIATAKLFLRDGRTDMDAHRGFPTPLAALTHFTKINKLFPKSRIFNKYFLGWCNLNAPHQIDLCISHFMLINRRVFDKIGKWDEDYFVYGEDVDFCYRAKQAGFKIMYLPQWTTLHYKGAGVGRKESKDIKTASNQSSETKKRMKEESVKAMKIFYQKHYRTKYPKFVTWLVLGGITVLEKIR